MITTEAAVRLILAVAAVVAAAQEPHTVTVHVSVSDTAGRPVTDLEPGEIQVSAGASPVPAAIIRPPGEPLTVVLLVDGSASATVPAYYRDAAVAGILKHLREDDRLVIHGIGGPFSRTPVARAAKPGDLSALFTRIAAAQEPSPLWDAVIASLDAARAVDPPGRPIAVMLLSDGRATGNRCGINDAARRALQFSASVSVVLSGEPTLIAIDGPRALVVDPGRVVRQLTDATGGLLLRQAIFPPDVTEKMSFRAAVEKLTQDSARTLNTWLGHMQHRYRVGIQMPAAASPAPLRVTVRRPGVTVTAPQAYVTSAEPPPCALPPAR